MAKALSKDESKNMYSWWWDSHIPKNSKWLQENLTDMDVNVKSMIQLIEEDADSFAQRAEMFYQKRPKLMKLVEEFYRAYRALAERYEHASGAIRQAHKTMSEVFPNQIPSEVSSPRSECSTPNFYFGTPPLFEYDSTSSIPVSGWRNEVRKLLDFSEDEGKVSSELLAENQNFKNRIVEESELNVKSEGELHILQRAHAKLKSEKEEALQQFRHSLGRIASLEAEVEGFQMQNSKMAVEIIRLETVDENCRLLEKEKKSMLSESEILEKKAIKQSEQHSAMQEELEKLKLSLKDEHLRCLHAEAALLSLEKLHSQSVEALRISELEIEMRDHLLKETEVEKKSLEEEVGRFKNEIRGLNDLSISSKKMTMEMEIEISRLKEEKKKVEAEVENQGGLKKMVEEELGSLKEEIDYLRKCNRDATNQIEAVGLNEESLRESVKELLVSNVELRDVCKKIEDGNLLLSEKVMRMEEIKEKNVELEVSVSNGNIELENLRLKIEELEESLELLCGRNSSLESEKITLVSMVDNVKGDIEIMTEKNTDLENFLSEAVIELEGLRGNLKNLEESCQILVDDKSKLQIQKNTLINQLEIMGNNLEDLGSRYAELQDLYSNVERGKEAKETQLAELQNLHKIQRRDHELFTNSIGARLIELEEEIRRLLKEGECRAEQFQNKQCNLFAAELEIFVIRRSLDDLKDKNCSLSKDLRKTEECILRQKEKEVVLLDQIERLKKVICHVWRTLNTEDDNCDVMMITNGAEDLYQRYISDKIKLLQNSIRGLEVDKQSLQTERSVFVTLLQQLGHQVTDLRSEKNDLYRDYRNKSEEVLSLQSEQNGILEMNKKLVEASVVGRMREEKMELEAEILGRRASDLQAAYSVSQDENRKLVEENGGLSTKFYDLEEGARLLEEEYNAILRKAMALDSLTVVFQQFGCRKIENLKILEDELNRSRKTNDDLEIKAVEMMEKVGLIEEENSNIKNLVALKLEEYRDHMTILAIDMSMARTLNEDLSGQIRQLDQLIDNSNSLLIQKDSSLLVSDQNFQLLKNQNECLHGNLERVTSELDGLEKKIMNKDKVIAVAVQLNEIMCNRMQRLEEENKDLRTEEKNLKDSFEEEFTAMCGGMHVADVHAVLFEEKVRELMEVCEDLKTRNMAEREASIEELSSKSSQIGEINEQLNDLAGKNEEMKSELNEYASVISALDDNISALEDSIPSSRKSIQSSSSSSSSSSDHLKVQDEESGHPKHLHKSPRGTGIVELRRLLCKVKSLRDALADSRCHVPPGKAVNSMLHSRKSTIEEMKDIPLDHISSPTKFDLVGNDQMLQMWEHDHDTKKNHDAEDELKSEEYTCSEKELAEVEIENFIQDWNKEVVERLSSDAGKLSNLQAGIFELKTKIMDLENAKFPKSFEFETIKVQLCDTELRILQSVETNQKLIRRARDCSRNAKAAGDDDDKEIKKQERNKKKKQVSERVRRGSDKIGRMELDLQKYQYVLLKLEEEYENHMSKAVAGEKKYTVLLKDYLYGGNRRRIRRPVTNGHFCGCI